MYRIKATGEHEGFTGKFRGFKWADGVAEVRTRADRDFLVMGENFLEEECCVDFESVETVLVIGHVGLGDWMMVMPTLQAIRLKYPKAKLTVAPGLRCSFLFKENPYVDDVIEIYPENLLHVVGDYEEVYNLAFGLHYTPDSEFIDGYEWPLIRFGLEEYPLDSLNGPSYVVSDKEKKWARDYLGAFDRTRKTITLHPESTSVLRSFSPDKTEILITALKKFYNVVCISKDAKYEYYASFKCGSCTNVQGSLYVAGATKAAGQCDSCGAWVVAGQGHKTSSSIRFTSGNVSFRRCAALVAEADFHVGIDSAFMHVAAALGKSQVAVFSSSDSKLRTKNLKNVSVIQVDFPCGPCNLHDPGLCVKRPNRGYGPCIESVEIKSILNAIRGAAPPYPNRPDGEERDCPMCGSRRKMRMGNKTGVSYHGCLDCRCIYSNYTPRNFEGYGDDYADFMSELTEGSPQLDPGKGSLMYVGARMVTLQGRSIGFDPDNLPPFGSIRVDRIVLDHSVRLVRNPLRLFTTLTKILAQGGTISILSHDADHEYSNGITESMVLVGYHAGETSFLPTADGYKALCRRVGLEMQGFEMHDHMHVAVFRRA